MTDPFIKEAASLMEQAKGALSQVGGAVQEGAGKAGELVNAGVDKVKGLAGQAEGFVNDRPDLKKLLPYLLAGGAGAAAGGVLTGKRKARTGETRGQYLMRILRNASVAGGLAGGGSYLAHEGFKKTLGSVDVANPLTGKEGDQGPLASAARNVAFSPVTAGAAGLAGLGATAKLPGIGANPNAAEHATNTLAGIKQEGGGKLPKGIKTMADVKMRGVANPADLQSMLGDPSTPAGKGLRSEAHNAGLNTHDPGAVTKLPDKLRVPESIPLPRGHKIPIPGGGKEIPLPGSVAGREFKGLAHKTTELGRLPSALLGRSTKRRIGRGAVGVASALIPALIGAIATNKPE